MDDHRTKLLDMPEWLIRDEDYSPLSDKDTFTSKSILSLLRVLSRIKAQDSRKTTKHNVNTVFRIASVILLLAMLSISKNPAFVMIIIVYLLAVLSLMEAKDIVGILKVSLAMSFFTFVVLLPAALWGNTYSSVMITAKVFASITAVNIVFRTTKWNTVTSALKRFFVPDIFVLVLDITIKYIVMLGDFSLNMLYALKSRSVGRNKNKYTSLSGVAGTLFIKSKEMAEDMYDAMECRGFTGEYHVHSTLKFTIADLMYLAINGGIFLIFLYLGRT